MNGFVRQLEASASRLVAVDEKLYEANALHSYLRHELVTASDDLGGLLVGLRRSDTWRTPTGRPGVPARAGG